MPAQVRRGLAAFRKEHVEAATKVATRKASEMALGVDQFRDDADRRGIGGPDHSNLTITKGMESIAPGRFKGRYIHYGIREHGMAAAMNGIALHGGFVPYGGTFLVFTDYARGAMRLSALMGQRVIYVMTHDSIGLGEDGPTHQPVEHLAMLRATPNINVFRPADIIETAEAWELALETADRPSVLVAVPAGPADAAGGAFGDNRSARGAYVLHEPKGQREVTILSTGSEVEIARAAADRLLAEIRTSMPPWFPCPVGNCSRPRTRAIAGVRSRQGSAHRHRGRRAARLGPVAWREPAPSSA
jgi:transketolase